MALREIRTFDDPILRKVCRPVEKFDDRLATLIDDMAETMYRANGAGLAAPQVGILRRVVVVDAGNGLIELVNPVVIATDGEQTGNEGCLSFPGQWGTVTRPNYAKVRAQDRHGNFFEVEGTELQARAFCHELDHLDGKLFQDIATELETDDAP